MNIQYKKERGKGNVYLKRFHYHPRKDEFTAEPPIIDCIEST